MIFFLIGLMGSGKTTLGKAVADELKLDFIDLDESIENREKTTIQNIFSEKGESEFRKLEEEQLSHIISIYNKSYQHLILACGGGTPCFRGNMKKMKEDGITIYLKTEVSLLAKRLEKDKNSRPLLKTGNSLEETLNKLLSEREEIYTQAHHVLANPDQQRLSDLIEKSLELRR